MCRPASVRLLATVVLCVGGLGIASCGGGGDGADATVGKLRNFELELVIGDLVPLSGPHAALGAPQQKATDLAISEINDAIGEADVDHVVEVVHEDAVSAASRGSPRVIDGARCAVGPATAEQARALSRSLSGEVLTIMPAALAGPGTRARRGSSIAELTGLGANPARGQDDAQAAFAAAFPSFPPRDVSRGPLDARYFDATVLCYLAAVGAGSTDPLRMAASLARIDRPGGQAFSWQQLPEAIDALERGAAVHYVGASGPFRIEWSGSG